MTKILVAEDEEMIRDMYTLMLPILGYEAVITPNADEALRELSSANNIEIIVLDNYMGKGMSGIEVLYQLRNGFCNYKYHYTPVLVVTGQHYLAAKAASLDASYLGKPFTLHQLKATLEKIKPAK